jgi:tetratricopeptide (TPR) repeat protein/predicted Ser/Thr protein kinase
VTRRPPRDADSDPLAATAAADATAAVGGAATAVADGTPRPRNPRAATPIAATELEGFPARPSIEIPKSTQVGRFVVLDMLGKGGMGMVLAAYDPQLDRKIAIKMLHDDVSVTQSARLEREAKAMAQLSHPNVVTVHETGTFEGRLYIAMEYVVGETLGQWLRSAPRERAQIFELLLQAGRGLAAAHAVGLVHRDFKPDNVLVGKDGRARVSDFGLVSAIGEAIPQGASPKVLSPSALTMTGTVMGTPLYMAPEQHDGRVADAKADQFSFCVTAWQALCDEAPYGADTYEELVSNVTTGKLRPMPRGVRVPAKVRAILARGLDTDPAARFPSMQALLVALERALRPRRWPYLAAGSVAIAGAAVALGLAARGGEHDPCAGSAQRLAGVWDAPRKARLQAAFEATGATVATDVWRQIATALDGYTTRWVARHHAVCTATHERGEQSAELLDLRMRCLDGRLADLDALLGRFAETDRDHLFKALDATVGLRGFDDCDDVVRLRAAIPLPDDPTKRARIDALEHRFAEAVSFDKIGRNARAREIAIPLVVEARQLGYAPIEAKAILLRAGEEYRGGDLAVAEQSYREAAEAAARARDDERIAQSWIDLMNVRVAQGHFDAALDLLATAKIATERVSDQPRLGARLANVLAGVYLAQGKIPDAKAQYEHALELVRKDKPDSDLLGPALHNMGTVLWYVGDTAAAEKYFADARARFEATVGPRHPMLGYVHRSLGDVAIRNKNLDGAIAEYREAAQIFEDAHGPEHVDIAIALDPLSYSYAQKHDAVHAREAAERSLALRQNKFGPDHPSLVLTLGYLADAEVLDGSPAALADALARLTRAVAIQEKAFGKDAPQLAPILDQLADVADKLGKRDVAAAARGRRHAVAK